MQNKVENWADNLTPEEQQKTYNVIANYLKEEVIQKVSEKYNKPIAYKYQNV